MATVTVDYADLSYVTYDQAHNPNLVFTQVPSGVPAYTVRVTGDRADLVAYLTDYYGEGDPETTADCVAAIQA